MGQQFPGTGYPGTSQSISLDQLLQLPLENRYLTILSLGRIELTVALQRTFDTSTAISSGITVDRLAWAVAFNVEGAVVSAVNAASVSCRGTRGYRDHWPAGTQWIAIWSSLNKPFGNPHPGDATLLQELAVSVACEQREDWQHPDVRPIAADEANRWFDFVYARDRAKVVGDVFRRFGTRAGDPEAIASEAWSRVFCDYWSSTARRRFLGLCRISTLVCQVARFVAIDALRMRGASISLDETSSDHEARRSALALEQLGFSAEPSAKIAEEEFCLQIRQCLECLPVKQRIVAEMVWVREIRAKQAAELLRISEPAVSQHLKRARENIRNCLRVRGFDAPGER